MNILFIISSNEAETVYNAMRLANASVGKGDEVRREKTVAIIKACRVIMAYCEQYRFFFSREEVEKYISLEEMWAKKFGCDPIWGNYGDDKQDDGI